MGNKSCPSHPYHLGNDKDFRNSGPGNREEGQISISHITVTHIEIPKKYPEAFGWPRVTKKIIHALREESRTPR